MSLTSIANLGSVVKDGGQHEKRDVLEIGICVRIDDCI